jgi:hypothetical protein
MPPIAARPPLGPLPALTATTTMTQSQLALELVQKIVDESSSERNTLKALALVCRAWTGRAQKHIFYSVLISGPRIKNPAALAGSLHELCTFLETHPHLQQHVHELNFAIPPVGRQKARLQAEERARISALLPHVHTVVIVQFWVDMLLLSALPALRTLSLYNCGDADDLMFNHWQTGPRSCIRGLHTLSLHYGCSAIGMLENLQLAGAFADLRKVAFVSRNAEEYAELLRLLNRHDHLRELSLVLNYGPFHRSSACEYAL